MKWLLSLAAALAAVSAHAATFNVASPADPQWAPLQYGAPAVLYTAQPGDTIVLGSGAYPALNPGYAIGKASPGVTITAAKGATVKIAGVTFSAGGWHLSAGAGAITVTAPIEVSNADGVVLDGLEVAGPIPADLTTMGGAGIAYRNVTNFSVTHCKIHHWGTALTGLGVKGFTVTDNVFSYTSSDLVHLGGDISNAQIGRNLFTQVHSSDLVHQDALQIFSTYATAPMDSISIFDNQIIRGVGGAPVQGIFMNGSTATPYTNLKITGNMVMTGNYWGIGTQAAQNFVISNNYVGGYTDAMNGSQVMTPWIKLLDSSNGVVDSNVAPAVITDSSDTGVAITNTTTVALAAPDDLTAANAWWTAKSGTVAATPPAAPDPLAGQVASLTAQLATAQSQASTSAAQVTILQGQLAAAQAKIANAKAALN